MVARTVAFDGLAGGTKHGERTGPRRQRWLCAVRENALAGAVQKSNRNPAARAAGAADTEKAAWRQRRRAVPEGWFSLIGRHSTRDWSLRAWLK